MSQKIPPKTFCANAPELQKRGQSLKNKKGCLEQPFGCLIPCNYIYHLAISRSRGGMTR